MADRAPRVETLSVFCPSCGVESGKKCRTSGGNYGGPHAARKRLVRADKEPGNKIVQPLDPPNKVDGLAIWDLVIEDMRARDRFGARKYGQQLKAFDGRDALTDAYQEALDLCVYLRKAIYEKEQGNG